MLVVKIAFVGVVVRRRRRRSVVDTEIQVFVLLDFVRQTTTVVDTHLFRAFLTDVEVGILERMIATEGVVQRVAINIEVAAVVAVAETLVEVTLRRIVDLDGLAFARIDGVLKTTAGRNTHLFRTMFANVEISILERMIAAEGVVQRTAIHVKITAVATIAKSFVDIRRRRGIICTTMNAGKCHGAADSCCNSEECELIDLHLISFLVQT